MKRIFVSVFALILFSCGIADAQEKVSLILESTLSGEDEKKVVEVPEFQIDEGGGFNAHVPVPFGDSYWVCTVDGNRSANAIYVTLTDPGAIKRRKDGNVFPLVVFSAWIPFWSGMNP